MTESSGSPETGPQEEVWKWEVVENPAERLEIIGTTLQERTLQEIAAASGFAQLAVAEHRTDHAQTAQVAVNVAAQQIKAILRVIEMDPKEPLPIDRTTYRGRAILVWDQLPPPNSGQGSLT